MDIIDCLCKLLKNIFSVKPNFDCTVIKITNQHVLSGIFFPALST